MTKMINLTPHAVDFIVGDNTIRVPVSGQVARLTTDTMVVGDVNGIPVTATIFGGITGLPDPAPDTIYIVSALVAGRVPNRTDVFIPNDSVRDADGRIIGCKSLGRI